MSLLAKVLEAAGTESVAKLGNYGGLPNWHLVKDELQKNTLLVVCFFSIRNLLIL
jgi:hypothetical protein